MDKKFLVYTGLLLVALIALGSVFVHFGTTEVGDCVDTDGDSIYTKGSVTFAGEVFTDHCPNAAKVYEYLCKDGKISYEIVFCPIVDDIKLLCSDGVCK